MPTSVLHRPRAIHDYASDLIEIGAHLNSLPTIGILSWLYYPDVSLNGILFTNLFHYGVTLNGLSLFFLVLLIIFLIISGLVFLWGLNI